MTLLIVATTVGVQAAERGLTRAESEAVFAQNENYAIVVGVDEYESMPGLRYAKRDAGRMAGLFRKQGYTVFELVDWKASPRRILKQIEQAGQLATNEGRERRGNVVFAFAGHGFRDGRQNYLATGETDPDDLVNTALPVSAVREALEASGVRQRVLLIDACRNVPGARSAGDPEQVGFAPDEDAEGVAVMYSTGARQLSFEDPGLGQGVFTHYVAEGLSGEAAGPDGLVTFDRLRRYVEGKVKRHVIEAFGEVQVPYVGGERTGEFVLARAVSAGGSPEAIGDIEDVPDFDQVSREIGRLTVRAEPVDARVRIMNIGPRYRDGIELARGEVYDVLVEREGYEPWREVVVLEEADQTVRVTLAARSAEAVRDPGAVEDEGARRSTAFAAARPAATDSVEARTWYAACAIDEAADCTSLGRAFEEATGVERSYTHAATLYERACEGGDLFGCGYLGVLHEYGRGVSVDKSRAAALYERLCEGGGTSGCIRLGQMYLAGQGVPKDAATTARLYERACEAGDGWGCSKLAYLYENGTGVTRDRSEAHTLRETACRRGDADACRELGFRYQTGRSASKDEAVAASWYKLGCDGGNVDACSNLAGMYERGQGVSLDLGKARALYRRACDGGKSYACQRLEEV